MLDADGTTVSEPARRTGVTRQSAHQAVPGRIGAGLPEQDPDPASAHRRLIRVTAEGQRVHAPAQATVQVIETVLVDRIGPRRRCVPRARRSPPTGGEPPLVGAP
ncbi:MarR family transcriptional regulator [Streptomyces sp. NPDC056580]|uniref:MarR family transcriptional regulator n=1 Tax=Streptomyces sp. NPDC056580 TaxID=3345872 RepID=UPI00367BF3B5